VDKNILYYGDNVDVLRCCVRAARRILAMLLLACLLAFAAVALASCSGGQTPLPSSSPSASGASVEAVFVAHTATGSQPTQDELRRTTAGIVRRLKQLGIDAAQVSQRGDDQILVRVPASPQVDQVLTTVAAMGWLEFYVDADTRIAGPAASRADVLRSATGLIPKADMTQLQAYVTALKTDPTNAQPDPNYSLIQAPAGIYLGNKAPVWFLYEHKPAMTGAAISSARQGFQSTNNAPNVLIDFTSKGGQQFADVTKQLSLAGALKGVNQSFAIVLDNAMESDPIVDYQQNPQGIQGGSAEIDGSFTVQEAKDLALVINTGDLPLMLTRTQ